MRDGSAAIDGFQIRVDNSSRALHCSRAALMLFAKTCPILKWQDPQTCRQSCSLDQTIRTTKDLQDKFLNAYDRLNKEIIDLKGKNTLSERLYRFLRHRSRSGRHVVDDDEDSDSDESSDDDRVDSLRPDKTKKNGVEHRYRSGTCGRRRCHKCPSCPSKFAGPYAGKASYPPGMGGTGASKADNSSTIAARTRSMCGTMVQNLFDMRMDVGIINETYAKFRERVVKQSSAAQKSLDNQMANAMDGCVDDGCAVGVCPMPGSSGLNDGCSVRTIATLPIHVRSKEQRTKDLKASRKERNAGKR